MKHELRIGALLGAAAALFTLVAFPSLLVGIAVGVAAGVLAAALSFVASRRPMPERYDPDDDGGEYEIHPPTGYLAAQAARQQAIMEEPDDEELYDWYNEDECTPSRSANLTGRQASDRQRIPLPELIERTEDELIQAMIGADELPAAAEEQPIAVPDWPVRVVQPVPSTKR